MLRSFKTSLDKPPLRSSSIAGPHLCLEPPVVQFGDDGTGRSPRPRSKTSDVSPSNPRKGLQHLNSDQDLIAHGEMLRKGRKELPSTRQGKMLQWLQQRYLQNHEVEKMKSCFLPWKAMREAHAFKLPTNFGRVSAANELISKIMSEHMLQKVAALLQFACFVSWKCHCRVGTLSRKVSGQVATVLIGSQDSLVVASVFRSWAADIHKGMLLKSQHALQIAGEAQMKKFCAMLAGTGKIQVIIVMTSWSQFAKEAKRQLLLRSRALTAICGCSERALFQIVLVAWMSLPAKRQRGLQQHSQTLTLLLNNDRRLMLQSMFFSWMRTVAEARRDAAALIYQQRALCTMLACSSGAFLQVAFSSWVSVRRDALETRQMQKFGAALIGSQQHVFVLGLWRAWNDYIQNDAMLRSHYAFEGLRKKHIQKICTMLDNSGQLLIGVIVTSWLQCASEAKRKLAIRSNALVALCGSSKRSLSHAVWDSWMKERAKRLKAIKQQRQTLALFLNTSKLVMGAAYLAWVRFWEDQRRSADATLFTNRVLATMLASSNTALLRVSFSAWDHSRREMAARRLTLAAFIMNERSSALQFMFSAWTKMFTALRGRKSLAKKHMKTMCSLLEGKSRMLLGMILKTWFKSSSATKRDIAIRGKALACLCSSDKQVLLHAVFGSWALSWRKQKLLMSSRGKMLHLLICSQKTLWLRSAFSSWAQEADNSQRNLHGTTDARKMRKAAAALIGSQDQLMLACAWRVWTKDVQENLISKSHLAVDGMRKQQHLHQASLQEIVRAAVLREELAILSSVTSVWLFSSKKAVWAKRSARWEDVEAGLEQAQSRVQVLEHQLTQSDGCKNADNVLEELLRQRIEFSDLLVSKLQAEAKQARARSATPPPHITITAAPSEAFVQRRRVVHPIVLAWPPPSVVTTAVTRTRQVRRSLPTKVEVSRLNTSMSSPVFPVFSFAAPAPVVSPNGVELTASSSRDACGNCRVCGARSRATSPTLDGHQDRLPSPAPSVTQCRSRSPVRTPSRSPREGNVSGGNGLMGAVNNGPMCYSIAVTPPNPPRACSKATSTSAPVVVSKPSLYFSVKAPPSTSTTGCTTPSASSMIRPSLATGTASPNFPIGNTGFASLSLSASTLSLPRLV